MEKNKIELDVRGLSCPEPVLMVMDALDELTDGTIEVVTDYAYTRDNIIKLVLSQKRHATVVMNHSDYVITIH